MIKRILIGLLIRILDSSLLIDYSKIDQKSLEDWAFKSFNDKGWRSYFAYEDLKIMKSMTFGKDDREYWILVGRRLQLLYLFDAMKQSYQNKISKQSENKNEKK